MLVEFYGRKGKERKGQELMRDCNFHKMQILKGGGTYLFRQLYYYYY